MRGCGVGGGKSRGGDPRNKYGGFKGGCRHTRSVYTQLSVTEPIEDIISRIENCVTLEKLQSMTQDVSGGGGMRTSGVGGLCGPRSQGRNPRGEDGCVTTVGVGRSSVLFQ